MRMMTFVAVLAALMLALVACGDDAADAPDDQEQDATTPDAGDDGGAELGDDVAAIVNGETIADGAVRDQVEAFASNPQIATALEGPEGEQTLGLLRAQVVTTMIINQVAIEGADELGVPVTDDDIATARTRLEEETGGAENLVQALEAEGMTEDQLTTQLRALAALRNIQGALGEETESSEADAETRAQEFVAERLQGAEVVVNDEYGVWDPQTGQVTPPGGVPVPSAAPQPAPES